MASWEPGETGIATWVVEHNEPVLIADEKTDEPGQPLPRHGRDRRQPDRRAAARPGGRVGVLTLERLGDATGFDEQEFELVKLFAAQVSIALRNAEIFREAEVRARTDDLTGLLNYRTVPRLARAERRRRRAVRPRDGRPRRVQDGQRHASATRPATGCCARSRAPSRPARATPTPCSATAATSSSSSCRAATRRACGRSPSASAAAVAGVGGEGTHLAGRRRRRRGVRRDRLVPGRRRRPPRTSCSRPTGRASWPSEAGGAGSRPRPRASRSPASSRSRSRPRSIRRAPRPPEPRASGRRAVTGRREPASQSASRGGAREQVASSRSSQARDRRRPRLPRGRHRRVPARRRSARRPSPPPRPPRRPRPRIPPRRPGRPRPRPVPRSAPTRSSPATR